MTVHPSAVCVGASMWWSAAAGLCTLHWAVLSYLLVLHSAASYCGGVLQYASPTLVTDWVMLINIMCEFVKQRVY